LAVKTEEKKYVGYIKKIELVDGVAQYSNKTQSFVLTIAMAILTASRKLQLLKDTGVRKIPIHVLKQNLIYFYGKSSNGYVNKIIKEFLESPFISYQDEKSFTIKPKKDIIEICLAENPVLKKNLTKERLVKNIETGLNEKKISLVGKTLEKCVEKTFSLVEYKKQIVIFEACKPMLVENNSDSLYIPFYNFDQIATITKTSTATVSRILKNKQKMYSFELITLKKHVVGEEDLNVLQDRQSFDDKEKAFLTVVKVEGYNAVLKFNGTRVVNDLKYKMFTITDVKQKPVNKNKERCESKFVNINKTPNKLSNVKKTLVDIKKRKPQDKLELISLDNAHSQAVRKMADSFGGKVASKYMKLFKNPEEGINFQEGLFFQIKGVELKKTVEKIIRYCDLSKNVCSDGRAFRRTLKSVDVSSLYSQRAFLHATGDKRAKELEFDRVKKMSQQKI